MNTGRSRNKHDAGPTCRVGHDRARGGQNGDRIELQAPPCFLHSMTYCIGVLLDDGLIFASDSRTTAGMDSIAKFCKMTVFERPGDRVIVLLSSGNLAGTQAVNQRKRRCSGVQSAGPRTARPSSAPCGSVAPAVTTKPTSSVPEPCSTS